MQGRITLKCLQLDSMISIMNFVNLDSFASLVSLAILVRCVIARGLEVYSAIALFLVRNSSGPVSH